MNTVHKNGLVFGIIPLKTNFLYTFINSKKTPLRND
jgi:hypothetical protein